MEEYMGKMPRSLYELIVRNFGKPLKIESRIRGLS